jgi:hypothetical protein
MPHGSPQHFSGAAKLALPYAEAGAGAQRSADFHPATAVDGNARGILSLASDDSATSRDVLFAALAVVWVASASGAQRSLVAGSACRYGS